MSGKIAGMVWDLALPQNKMLVLLAMADHADHNGNNVHPSMELVAWKTGYSKRQVQRIVTELAADGLLIPTQQDKGKVVIYKIDLSKGKTKPQIDRQKRGRPTTKTHDAIVSPVLEEKVGHPDVTPISEKPMTSTAEENQKTHDIQMSPEPSLEPSEKITATNVAEKSGAPEQPGESGGEPKTIALTDYQRFTGKLAEICKRDLALPSVKHTVIANAAELWSAGYRESDLDTFAAWWPKNDWRGKKGQSPTLVDVKRDIKQAVEAKGRVNGKGWTWVHDAYAIAYHKDESERPKLLTLDSTHLLSNVIAAWECFPDECERLKQAGYGERILAEMQKRGAK